jgi:hypothetical protein
MVRENSASISENVKCFDDMPIVKMKYVKPWRIEFSKSLYHFQTHVSTVLDYVVAGGITVVVEDSIYLFVTLTTSREEVNFVLLRQKLGQSS